MRRSHPILCHVGALVIAWHRAWPTTCRSLCIDRVKSRGSVGAEAELSWGGGSADVNPEAAEALKWIAEAWREQLVLYTNSEAIVTHT